MKNKAETVLMNSVGQNIYREVYNCKYGKLHRLGYLKDIHCHKFQNFCRFIKCKEKE